MPKMKTKSGAAKRFRLTKKGRVKRGGAKRSHILTKMTAKVKRNLRGKLTIAANDVKSVKKMLRK